VEKTSAIGGMVIKCEDVFANLECATCMIAPKQQEVLQKDLIDLVTLGEILSIDGSAGDFTVRIRAKAGYVDPVNCIGCGACYEACPVSIPNEFEEKLSQRKAISTPCAGALPNVPYIDTEHCVRFTKNEQCTTCQEACVFEAIDFSHADEEKDLHVAAIVVATGFKLLDASVLAEYGYGKIPGVYTAYEFERLFASNGPTAGEIVLRDGKTPASAAIVHCVQGKEKTHSSFLCSMYPLKFAHYFKKKVPDAKLFEFYKELCIPGKSYQSFFEQTRQCGVEFIRSADVSVTGSNGKATVTYKGDSDSTESIEVDMVILSPVIEVSDGTVEIAKLLGLTQNEDGFLIPPDSLEGPVCSQTPGVYIAGCARGPTDIQGAVTQAQAAVGKILTKVGQNRKEES